jgi:transcriptional regulator with XRE-family HTH domain
MMKTATHKPLFGTLIEEHIGLKDDIAAVEIAAELVLLLAHAKVSQTELAKRLNWSRGRVSQVLSGRGNLTIQTISAITHALGHRFDLTFRTSNETRTAQPWHKIKGQTLELKVNQTINLGRWLGQDTLRKREASFFGAREFKYEPLHMTGAANQSSQDEEDSIAA